MSKLKFGFAFSITVLALGGCGASDAIQSTKGLPGQMAKMSNTTDDLDTNMKAMALDTAEKTRLQQLLFAENLMFEERNTRFLKPAPIGMMKGAEVFALVVKPEELVKLALANFKSIEDLRPADSEKVLQKAPDSQNDILDYPPELRASVDHQKDILFYEIALVSAFAPVKVIDEMIRDQITQHGPYETSALQVLMLRADAMRSYLIQEMYLNAPLAGIGELELATTRTEYVKQIVNLPFASKLSYSTIGMLNRSENYNLKMDPSWIPGLKQKLLLAAKTELPDDEQGTERYAAVLARINAL